MANALQEGDIIVAAAPNGGNLITLASGELIWVSPAGTRTTIAGA